MTDVSDIFDDPPDKLPAKKKVRHEATDSNRKIVSNMVGQGSLENGDIARIMGIPVKLLEKLYAHEIATARARMNLEVAQNLFRIATDPYHKSAAMVGLEWLRQHDPAWKPHDKRIQIDQTVTTVTKPPSIDTSNWTIEQRQHLKQVLLAMKENEKPRLTQDSD
jgi:hypothetical protein